MSAADEIRVAYDLLGSMLERIPADIPITSWEITPNYIGGQLDPDLSPAVARRAVRAAADLLDLNYTIDDRATFDQINADAQFVGARLQIWAHVSHPRIEEPT